VSTIRAEDCKARLLLFPKGKRQRKYAHYGPYGIWENGKTVTDISASFYPEVLTILRFDPLAFEFIPESGKGAWLLPAGTYELGLVLDAKGTSSTEIWLGEMTLPDDLIKDKDYITYWKDSLREGEWAVFFEKTLAGQPIAKVIGKMPDADLEKMKTDLKNYKIEFL
jgi:hypothetical protein